MGFVEAWEARLKEDREALTARFKTARSDAYRAAKLLVENFGVRRVYMFGSLLDEEEFMMHSDIDLAVEGLDPDVYFSALNKISVVAHHGIHIDLIPIEDAHDFIKARIYSEGIILYEKEHAHSQVRD
jgi:predicted nucleotidyltransferase